MSRIFLSHSHRDNPSALAIGGWLTDNGWSDFFLDISADRGLSPGERWQEALKRAADRCQAVLFLISDDWLQSRWCQAEFLLAKQLGKAIFGVLVRPVPLDTLPPEMRNEWQLCDLVAGVERETFHVRLEEGADEREISFAAGGLRRLRHGIERAGLDPSTFPWPPPTDPDRAPYSGLRAMDREDAAVFFGREAPLTLALDTLRRLRESGPERLFVVLGASGSGKSSFLRAGLLPRLARDDRNFLVTPIIRPERAAVSGASGLLNALDGACRSMRAPMNRADLRRALDTPAEFSRLVADLRKAAHARLGAETAAVPALVFAVDQAEELFANEGRAEAERLLTLLQGVLVAGATGEELHQDAGVFALASIRSDSYERLQTDPLMARVGQYIFNLPPIPREEYKVIIEGPAARHAAAGHRLRIEPQLTTTLLEDAQGADALPLLAFTLERLFVEQGADGLLSADDYRALGGVEGSLEAAVRTALADPRREPEIPSEEGEQLRQLRDAFIPWLARVDPETEERKRRVATWEEIPAASRAILERLIQQRLVLRDRRRLAGATVDTVVVEVAHEALLRRWPMLTLWLGQDADALKAVDLAKRAAAEWEKHGRREAWLNHTTERLSIVETLLTRADLDRLLGDEGRAYIRACRKRDDDRAAEARARETERQESERRVRQAEQDAERERLRVAEAQAAQASERAEAARRLSRRTLLGASLAVVFMIAAIAAAVWARNQQFASERALGTLNVTEASRKAAAGLVHESVAHLAEAVRLVPDQTVWRAALLSTLLTNRWGRPTAEIRTIEPATTVVFNTGGNLVLVVSGDDARLFDATTAQRVGRPLRHRNLVRDAQFSPDGTLIVTASQDRTVRIWNARTGSPVGSPLQHDSAVTRAAFSADQRYVVTLAGGRTRVLDRESPGGPGITPIELPWDARAAISGDGNVAVRSSGPSVAIYRREAGEHGGTANAPALPMRAVATGRFLASWRDTGATLFDLDPPLPPAISLQAAGDVTDLRLSNDGSRLLTIARADDRVVAQLWDVAAHQEIHSQAIEANEARAAITALCGRGVLAVASNNVVTLSDGRADTWREARVSHAAPVHFVRLSSDCRFGISLAGKEARVWDTSTGALVAQPLVHPGTVTGAAFGPGARHVATVSADGARVWDLQTGTAAGEPLRRPSQYSRIAFSDNGERVVTASGRQVRCWGTRAGTADRPAIQADGDVTALHISSDGERVLVTTDQTTAVYRTSSGERVGRSFRFTEAYRGTPGELRFSPAWNLALALLGEPNNRPGDALRVQAKSARIWRVDSGERQGKLLVHRQPITDIAFNRDTSRIVTASEDTTARVWSATTGEPVGTPMRHDQAVRRAIFSADGSRIVTLFASLVGEPGRSEWDTRTGFRAWNAATGDPVGEPTWIDEGIAAVAISPDGTRVLTASGRIAQLWDPQTAARVGNAIEFPAAVSDAAYSTDGTRILLTAGDTAFVYDAARLAIIGQPLKSAGDIVRARFTPDGQRLLIVTSEPGAEVDPYVQDPCFGGGCRQTAALWDVPTGDADDVPLLTRVAEILGGYRITGLGALEPVADRASAAATLVRPVGDDQRQSTGIERVARWLLADPATRAPSPFAATRARDERGPEADARR